MKNQTGKRFNKGKTSWALVSWAALKPMVDVLSFGADKYSPNNWKGGLKWTEVSESLLRHLTVFLEGEDNDPESKLTHVGHVLCNAMFLSYMYLFRKDLDDRFKDENLIDNIYPFKEGDDYWTIEDNKIVWSCWDDQSEELFNINKMYFKSANDAQNFLFYKNYEKRENSS